LTAVAAAGDIVDVTRIDGFGAVLLGAWALLCGCGGASGSESGSGGAGEGGASGMTGMTGLSDGTGSSGQVTGAASTGVVTTGAPTSGGSTGVVSTGEATSAGDGPRPDKPRGLESYLTGDDEDADVRPSGPGLIVMGGGTDVDEAFTWQLKYVGGGDVVVLRSSGSDGYNDYLFTDIGGIDSVETLLVTSAELANDPYVAWTIAHAEAVFMAGGDQATYLEAWKGTSVQDAIMAVWARGGVIGGTSAGTAVLGEFIYAAYNDSVIEDEALLDPYNKYMTFEREFLALPPLAGVITDTHFTARRRLCRLIGFVARMVQDGWGEPVLGVGVDEETALVIDPAGLGTVLGVGKVHLLRSAGAPQQCVAGKTLEYADLELHSLAPGETVQMPEGATPGAATPLSASMGALDPAYGCIE
jgi:cyanophycinase